MTEPLSARSKSELAIEELDAMIREEAETANRMAAAFPQDFDRLNASTGTGVRLHALFDLRSRIVKAALRAHEEEQGR